jgi:hypothetical protein
VAALPTSQYRVECWTDKAVDINLIQLLDMTYLRTVKDCTTLDHVKNEDIRTELKTVQNELNKCRQNWIRSIMKKH